MKRVYLLAHPAGHSLSPAMHNAAFDALGISARYEALDVAPGRLTDVVAGLRAENVLGANVTVPHKLAVKPLMDELTPAAKAIGAVNTVLNQAGKLLGHNTDAAGFLRALADADVELEGKHAVMLGAGGAARAVAYALLQGGSSLTVYNRSPEKAQLLAEAFSAHGDVSVIDATSLVPAVKTCDLLVNTTSVGMEKDGVDPDTSPLPDGVLPEGGFVSDIVYRPAKTRLLRAAEASGLKTQNGLPMLVYQGAESFSYWTGQQPDAAVMFAAAKASL